MEDREDIEETESEDEIIEQQQQHVETDIEKELAECREAKKAIEIKYQAALKELTSTNQARVERNVFNSGAEDSLSRLRKTVEIQETTISKLKDENERQKSDLEMWRNKYHEAEKQVSKHYYDEKRASMKTSCLEAEIRGLREKMKLMMNQSMNMSSASSIMSSRVPPPPPPVDVPSVDEFLKMSAEQNSYNMESNSSIPPPPPVDTPISDLIQQSLSGNRSVNSSYG